RQRRVVDRQAEDLLVGEPAVPIAAEGPTRVDPGDGPGRRRVMGAGGDDLHHDLEEPTLIGERVLERVPAGLADAPWTVTADVGVRVDPVDVRLSGDHEPVTAVVDVTRADVEPEVPEMLGVAVAVQRGPVDRRGVVKAGPLT